MLELAKRAVRIVLLNMDRARRLQLFATLFAVATFVVIFFPTTCTDDHGVFIAFLR